MEKEKSNCCCGCTFKTGSLIIGSLEMIGGLISFVSGLVLFIYYMADWRFYTVYRDARYAGIDILFGIILAIGAVSIAHAAVLIHGTRKGRQGLLHCWIIIQVINLVLSTIGAIVAAILVGYQDIYSGVSIAVGIVCILFIVEYYVFVVNAHRQELLDSTNDEPNGNAASFNEMENKTYNNMYPTKMYDVKV